MQKINTRRKDICIQQSSIGSDPYSTATVKELPTKKLSLEELPVEEVPVEEFPVEELPVDELPVEELPVEELTLEDFYNLYEALDFKWTPPKVGYILH